MRICWLWTKVQLPPLKLPLPRRSVMALLSGVMNE